MGFDVFLSDLYADFLLVSRRGTESQMSQHFVNCPENFEAERARISGNFLGPTFNTMGFPGSFLRCALDAISFLLRFLASSTDDRFAHLFHLLFGLLVNLQTDIALIV